MSKVPKRKHGCTIGCTISALLILLILAAVGLAAFYSPTVDRLTQRLDADASLEYTIAYAVDSSEVDEDELSAKAKQAYSDLQSCYNAYKHKGDAALPESQQPSEEGEGAMLTEAEAEDPEQVARFACSAVVEFGSVDLAETDFGYAYGLVMYVDSIRTAVEVFYAYYQEYSKNHAEASTSDYYLFMRGKALIVGNAAGLKFMYLNNIV